MSSSDNGIANGNELTWIAGSIVLSDNPPQQLKFWRKKFGIKQADLAKKMTITPSVLSDYEKGRRPSPGANFIKRYLQALYELSQSGHRPHIHNKEQMGGQEATTTTVAGASGSMGASSGSSSSSLGDAANISTTGTTTTNNATPAAVTINQP